MGREVARQAVAAGHDVTCLARGISGAVPDGARLVAVDRSAVGAYDDVQHDWDEVIEVSWQPGLVRGALTALAHRAGHWTYVSSISVYAPDGTGSDETTDRLPPTELDRVTRADYGQAKVACEDASVDHLAGRLLIARAGLIGGPGDATGRTGYWVARAARRQRTPMLVPRASEQPTQVVDVRDLAQFLLTAGGDRTAGVVDAVGPTVRLADWIALSRQVGGHTGPVVVADPDWLLEQGVSPWSGPQSLPLWVPGPDRIARSGAAARDAGLRHRAPVDLLTDLLAWERGAGLHRRRPAGLTDSREQELLAALSS